MGLMASVDLLRRELIAEADKYRVDERDVARVVFLAIQRAIQEVEDNYVFDARGYENALRELPRQGERLLCD